MQELVYPRLLLPAADRDADTVAFIDGEVQESLGVHVQRSLRLASALKNELGLGPEGRFAVLAGNSRHYVNLWHAAYLGGGVINPLNARLAPAELRFILQDSESEVVFVDADFASLVAGLRTELPGVRAVVLLGETSSSDVDVRFDDLVGGGDDAAPPEPEESDPCVLMYTGGTTGLPKGVLHTQRSQTLNVYRLGFMFSIFSQSHVYLQSTPMFHAGGAMGTVGMPVSGGTTVIQAMFEPGAAIDAVERHQVTVAGLVPTMVGMILNHPSFDAGRLQSLRLLGYGASPMPSGLLQQLSASLPWVDLLQTYGMTEASAVLTYLNPSDHRAGGARLGSAGRGLPGVKLSVQDPAGNLLPSGEIGEVCAQAGSFMEGYHNRPAETEEALRGGWYHTGDAGYLDEGGYLFLVDRVKDMIVTGGENVYSAEVESCISTYPAVAQVAVIGIPSERWGEQVHAIVVPRPGTDVSEADIIEHARGLIAGFKVPKSVEFRDAPLPLSGAMKVLKRDLRAPYWADHDRGVG